MICIILAALRFNELSWILPLLAWLFALGAVHEMHGLLRERQIEFSLPVAYVTVTALVASGLVAFEAFPWVAFALIGALLLCVFLEQIALRAERGTLTHVPALFFSLLYVGLPLACALQILQVDRFYFLFVLLAVWALDTAAFYVGCAIGRHKMAPRLSPKKSWEGAVAGLLGCLIAALLQRALFPIDMSWTQVAELGILFGVVGQLGDLAESALKRDAGVKDAGTVFRGHGGILDRMDSLLFCFIAFYLYLICSGTAVVRILS
jgi:phosphatidate cytidylyltransferase